MREGAIESTRDKRDSKTLEALNSYLFTEIPRSDVVERREEFIQQLEPYLIHLKIELNINNSSRQNVRRRSLKRVLLQLTSEVIGDTRVRLTRAFEYFDFISETIEAMKDNRWWVRAKGCKNAGLMLNESTLLQLDQCLDDENDDVRIEAAQSMLDIVGIEIIAPILMRLNEMSIWMQVRLSKSILPYGEHAVSPLVAAIQSKSPVIQGFCVDLLGILGDVKAVPTLLEYIDYAVPEVKHKSLIALGKLGDERSFPVIKKFLQSDDEQLRIDAVRAAGSLSTPSLAFDLHWMLINDVMAVKLATGEALSRSGERGIQSLKYALNHENEHVRMVALQFLHESGEAVHSEQYGSEGV